MLYIIGLGLGDEEDITLKGLTAVKKCSKVYLESYTSKLHNSHQLHQLYEKPVIIADRDFVETQAHIMIEEAKSQNIAFLVIGDPFGATTHSDLLLRTHEAGVEYQVVHNASIMNAVGCTGLQLYRFGQTVSIPFFDGKWKPTSFLEKILENYERDLHTLVLLDIKVKEQTVENMVKRNSIYEPPRFMKVSQAIDQIVESAEILGMRDQVMTWQIMGVRGVGSPKCKIFSGTLTDLYGKLPIEDDEYLESLVVTGQNLHEIEQKWFNLYKFLEK